MTAANPDRPQTHALHWISAPFCPTNCGVIFHRIKAIIAISLLAGISSGCALLGSRARVSIETTDALPGFFKQDLKQLAETPDVIADENNGAEMIRIVQANDEQNMKAYLRAHAYFDASVNGTIDTNGSRPHVIYRLQPGPLYQIASMKFLWPENYEGPRPAPPEPGKKIEERAASYQNLAAAQRSIITNLQERGYPDARVQQKEIVVDHASREARAIYEVRPGERTFLGEVRAEGLNHLRPSYVQKARTWRHGDLYTASKVDEYEKRLAASGLFSSILVTREKVANESDGEFTDIVLRLKERSPRTIQLGAGYRSDTGAETSAQWQHRNSLGGGEPFLIRARVFEDGYEGEMRLTVPYFRGSKNDLGLSLTTTKEETDAFDNLAHEGTLSLSRRYHRHFTVRGGFGLHYLDETSVGENQSYFLGSFPLGFIWDRANDKLDAERGYRVIFQTEPYQSLKNSDPFFWKNTATVNGFLPLRRDRQLVAAIRLSAGHIDGESIEDIPAETRFYAGGGQSVRGYAYQSLSPRRDDEIIGGKSLAETSFELRYRASRRFGVVVFIDGGTALDDNSPEYDATYRWGAGTGLRYFSPIGPLRFDAGFPIDRRDGVDDAWQFYVSIGQAF